MNLAPIKLTPMLAFNGKESSMRKTHSLFILAVALVALAIFAPSVQAQYIAGGPTYKDFATANGWYTAPSGTAPESWTNGRAPEDDPDNDGLTNEDEWFGWMANLNGATV